MNKLYVISKKHPTARNDQVYKVYKNRLSKRQPKKNTSQSNWNKINLTWKES